MYTAPPKKPYLGELPIQPIIFFVQSTKAHVAIALQMATGITTIACLPPLRAGGETGASQRKRTGARSVVSSRGSEEWIFLICLVQSRMASFERSYIHVTANLFPPTTTRCNGLWLKPHNFVMPPRMTAMLCRGFFRKACLKIK